MSYLSYEIYGDHSAPKTAVFLHGILGSKRNWRTPSKKFALKYPNFKSIIVDLRGHGLSHKLEGESTIPSCAQDLKELFSDLDVSPSIICGHSFGGKVALEYVSKIRTSHEIDAWVIDSLPGKYDFTSIRTDEQSVSNVFRVLSKMPSLFVSRDVVMEYLRSHDIADVISQWLCTNLVPSGRSDYPLTWNFELDVVSHLFTDYCDRDMWPVLEEKKENEGGLIHFVRAGKNKAWTAETLSRFYQLPSIGEAVRLHHMPHVGHWIHVDDLPGLLTLMHQHHR